MYLSITEAPPESASALPFPRFAILIHSVTKEVHVSVDFDVCLVAVSDVLAAQTQLLREPAPEQRALVSLVIFAGIYVFG